MYSQNSKLTTLTDHSHIRSTDQHYNPLRNALLKSQFPLQFISHPSQLNRQNFHSTLSNKVCRLTPQLARNIRNTSFIPIESELVPTKDLYKVAGKEFSILDVEHKRKEPLTASQFGRLPPCYFQQVVYQVKDNGSSLLSGSSSHSKKIDRHTNDVAKLQEEKSNGYATNQSDKRIQAIESKRTRAFHIQDSQENVGSHDNDYSRMSLSQGIQQYRFKTDLLSEGSTLRSQSKKKKKDYKYNLFSLLDQIGNNGCGAHFLSNQLCAARISNDNWN